MYDALDIKYDCPVEALSSILGKKWVGTIIWELQDHRMRFGELERSLNGCSKKMLSQQLDLLVGEKIILNEKKIENNVVESVYYLSEEGKGLLPIIKNMILWSKNNIKCKK